MSKKKLYIIGVTVAALLLSAAFVIDRIVQNNVVAELTEPTGESTSLTEESTGPSLQPTLPEGTEQTEGEADTPTETDGTVEPGRTEATNSTEESELPTEENSQQKPQNTSITVKEVNDIVYAVDTVNLRVGPGIEYEKAGTLTTGMALQRTGVTDTGWSRVRCDGSTYFAYSELLSTEMPTIYTEYPMNYDDSSCNITITKERFEGSWCYAAHLTFSDYTRLSTRCANGGYGNGYETTSSAADNAHAIFAVNGDYSAPYLDYIVVRNGKICNGAERSMWMPAVYSSQSGLLRNAWETGGEAGVAGVNVQELVNSGIVTDTFCFGPPLLANGNITVEAGGGRAQRTFIGTNGSPGDLWVVVSDGRYNDGSSAGLTAEECGRFLQSKGCVFGIPLDGGGSSTMYFNGHVLNAASAGERSVVDFLVFSK